MMFILATLLYKKYFESVKLPCLLVQMSIVLGLINREGFQKGLVRRVAGF